MLECVIEDKGAREICEIGENDSVPIVIVSLSVFCEGRTTNHSVGQRAVLEHIFDRDEPLHLFIIARHPPVVHQSSTSRAARPATPDRLAQFLYFRRQSLNRLFQQTDRLHISSPTEKADHVAGVVRSLPDNHMAEDDFANALRKRRQISITVTGRCTGRAITIPVWFVAAIARSGSCR